MPTPSQAPRPVVGVGRPSGAAAKPRDPSSVRSASAPQPRPAGLAPGSSSARKPPGAPGMTIGPAAARRPAPQPQPPRRDVAPRPVVDNRSRTVPARPVSKTPPPKPAAQRDRSAPSSGRQVSRPRPRPGFFADQQLFGGRAQPGVPVPPLMMTGFGAGAGADIPAAARRESKSRRRSDPDPPRAPAPRAPAPAMATPAERQTAQARTPMRMPPPAPRPFPQTPSSPLRPPPGRMPLRRVPLRSKSADSSTTTVSSSSSSSTSYSTTSSSSSSSSSDSGDDASSHSSFRAAAQPQQHTLSADDPISEMLVSELLERLHGWMQTGDPDLAPLCHCALAAQWHCAEEVGVPSGWLAVYDDGWRHVGDVGVHTANAWKLVEDVRVERVRWTATTDASRRFAAPRALSLELDAVTPSGDVVTLGGEPKDSHTPHRQLPAHAVLVGCWGSDEESPDASFPASNISTWAEGHQPVGWWPAPRPGKDDPCDCWIEVRFTPPVAAAGVRLQVQGAEEWVCTAWTASGKELGAASLSCDGQSLSTMHSLHVSWEPAMPGLNHEIQRCLRLCMSPLRTRRVAAEEAQCAADTADAPPSPAPMDVDGAADRGS
eukprot:TRINITY_DN6942_c2_g1_i1.p1 TRINITY_DN6942_c2_g1~~TRINITY_DN6942_c2_g1_i1.p1  ORF type:complete len:602 (+),score=165.13 TRINITY_DN6942_c2_g1_i1:148-1953(+)